jgi:hypothetical protein
MIQLQKHFERNSNEISFILYTELQEEIGPSYTLSFLSKKDACNKTKKFNCPGFAASPALLK